MESTESRPAPSASTSDLRPDAAVGVQSDLDRDPEQAVREAREAAGEAETTGTYREAVAASEAEVGAAATRDRIASGELTGADGQPVLYGFSPAERSGLAESYVSDVQQQAAAADVPLTETAGRLEQQTDRVHDHLATVYQDPDAALSALESLDAQGREDFGAGRTDLGERRADAPDAGPNTDALLAHLDVRDRHPSESAALDAARDQERVRELAAELDPSGPSRDSADLQNVDPQRSMAQLNQKDLMAQTNSQMGYQASLPQQI